MSDPLNEEDIDIKDSLKELELQSEENEVDVGQVIITQPVESPEEIKLRLHREE